MERPDAEIGLSPWSKAGLIVIGAFFAVSALVYGKAVVQSDFVRWDDGMLVFENPAIRAITPSTLAFIFTTYDPELYIPLTFLSYQIDYLIGGIEPLQYHVTNFLFHTLNGILAAWFGMLFFRRRAAGIVLGALFLLHPLNTEAIMWISGRKDLLSTFFFLLTLVYWMRWRDEPERRRYLLAVAFFALALLSKVMAITLPVVLLLLDWRDKRPFSKEWIVEKWPFFALSVLFGVIGLGGKTRVVASSSLADKILMAGKSSVFYLRKIVWPDSFSLLYPYHEDITIASPDFYVPILVWIGILALLALLWRRTRDVAFGVVFYLVTVGPTFLNFTKGGDLDVYFASDRYAYVPSLGVFVALLALALQLRGVVGGASREAMAKLGAGIAGVLLVFLAWRSHAQSQVWRDTYTLLSNVLEHYPESHVAHNNIGNARRLEGDLDAAVEAFQKAIAVRPHAKTYSNLGGVYRKQGKIAEALGAYQKALELNAESPEAYMGRGLVRMAGAEYALAEADFKRAIELKSSYLEAHTNLGAAYAYQNRMAEAAEQYRKAIALNPFFPDAHFNLGVALEATGDIEGAIAEYDRAASLAPRFIPARINLGLLLHRSGDPEGAREQFEAILEVDPNNAAARSALRQMGVR